MNVAAIAAAAAGLLAVCAFVGGLVALIAGPTLPTWLDLVVAGVALAFAGWLLRP